MKHESESRALPSGWQRCRLPEFTHIVMGQSPPSITYNHDCEGLPFFQGKAEFRALNPKVRTYCSQPRKVAKKGAILLSVRAPVGPTNLADRDCCIGRGLAAIHPAGNIAPRFVLYLMRSIEPTISNEGTGSTFTAISKDFLHDLSFNLPPWKEQPRIVAKIEELFSELDKGVESLKTARAKLDVYRQAVLKHAFEGKFTAQWREENKDKLEKPEQLLARIKKEREAHYEQQLKEWKAAVRESEESGESGKRPQRPKKPPRIIDLLHDVTAKLPPKPESWVWEKLAWMTCGVEYGTAAKSAAAGGVPVLRMGNIQKSTFDWADLVYTSDDKEIAEYLLHDGDVLFNRTNSPELVGKTAIYKGERSAVFAGYLIRVNHIRTVVDGQYLNLFLNSHIARQYGNNVKTDGVNQSNINGTKLSNYPFPYCSIEEQGEIAGILEKTLSVLDETEADIVEELQKANVLRQSILKKAFSGELVAQDPGEEAASVLLDRIRAEREKAAKNNHSKNTKKRKTRA